MTDPNLQLMEKIKAEFGPVLRQVAGTSSVPEGFLAAMIANETGGNPNVKRFESSVLGSLWQVLLGRKAAYGSIDRNSLERFVSGAAPQSDALLGSLSATDSYQRLDGLATSWGLTQILGYHCLESNFPAPRPEDLQISGICLKSTVMILGNFARQFNLDLANDLAELLRCWNSGRPDGKTFDPNYVENAMARKVLYESL